jgi:hypothetical protein
MGSAAKGSSGQHWQKQSGGVFESSSIFKFAATCSDSHGAGPQGRAGPRRRLCSTVTQLSVCGLCAVPCGTVP